MTVVPAPGMSGIWATTACRCARPAAARAGDPRPGTTMAWLHALTLLGFSALRAGQLRSPTRSSRMCLPGAQELGRSELGRLGHPQYRRVAHDRGDLRYRPDADRSGDRLFEAAECPFGVIEAQAGLALMRSKRGIFQAAACWRDASGPGDELGLGDALEGLGDIAIALHRWEWAARAAERGRGSPGTTGVAPSVRACAIRSHLRTFGPLSTPPLRDSLGRGGRCSTSEAACAGLRVYRRAIACRPPPANLVSNRFGLTRRELQVLELVAARRTNRQIAETLVHQHPHGQAPSLDGLRQVGGRIARRSRGVPPGAGRSLRFPVLPEPPPWL